MYKRSLMGLVAATLILSGCGGGGGGDSGPSYGGPTAAVSMTNTTEANTAAGFAASAAYDSSIATANQGNTPFAPTSGARVADPRSLSMLAKQIADMALNLGKSGTNLPTGATQSQTYSCADGGNIKVTFVYSAANTFTPGDSMTATYNNCVMYGARITGSVKLTFNTFVSTASTLDFSATYAANQYKVTEVSTGDYVLIHGGYTATISANSAQFASTVTGTSLLFQTSFGGTAEETLLSNFSYDDIIYSNYDMSFDHNFTIASTAIGGSVTVTTVTPFVVYSPDSYPTTGQVVVTGANNAKVRLTAENNATVTLDYDLDGNPGYETTVTGVPWSSL